MANTTVETGSGLAVKEYSVALFVQTQKAPSLQTSPGMPVVRITDLSKMAGEAVTMDCVNIIGGKPIMGDRNAEGKGRPLTFSTHESKINVATFPIDVGGRMSQQRTKHNLRSLGLANGVGLMTRYESESCITHLAGARGDLDGVTFAVPLASDPDFAEVLINPIKAPTYNRHYVVSGGGVALTQGGAQLTSIAATDIAKLDVLDVIRLIIDRSELAIQPIKLPDDPAANDDPLWLLLCPPGAYDGFKTNSGSSLRTFQQNAWNRASYGSRHPLFMGEVGLWNGILVKKMTDFWIEFLTGSTTKYNASTDTAGEESGTATIPALGGTHKVERMLLLGAQALANCYGRSQSSDFFYSWLEHKYNFERATEIAVETMGGKSKVRFSVPQKDGTTQATDHGVVAIDVAVKL